MNKFKKLEQKILNNVNAIRNGANSLYDVATDCLALWRDSREYADAIGIEADSVADHIQETFLADFNITLGELKSIMGYFPERAQWTKPLAKLYAEAAAATKADRDAEREHAPVRRTVKIADHEKVIEERDSAVCEAKNVRSMMADMQQKIRELETENALLRGRIQELERLVSRRGEMAYAG